MTIRHMQNELTQWGQWARGTERHCGLKRYESPCYTMLRQNVAQHTGGKCITLDDDALLAVDSLMLHCERSRPDLYRWLRAYYLGGYSLRSLEKLTKVSKSKIDQCLQLGETWLDARLEVLSEMSQKQGHDYA